MTFTFKESSVICGESNEYAYFAVQLLIHQIQWCSIKATMGKTSGKQLTALLSAFPVFFLALNNKGLLQGMFSA